MGLATTEILKNLNNKNDKLKKLSDVQLRKLQNTLLEMVKDFDTVCTRYGITYSLGGGSCLGAVRHNGFIPWDDDMDLNIPRKDYEKLRSIFQKELGEKYWLHCPEDKNNHGIASASFRKKGTIFRGPADIEDDREDGIFIDLCIIENTYNFRVARAVHGFLSLALGLIVSCRKFFKHRKFYAELAGEDKTARRSFRIKAILGFFVAWLSLDTWARAWNSVNKMCKNEKSKYVVVPTGRKHFFYEMYERDKYCRMIRHKFEDAELPIPVGYDEYMKNMYGDYMKIPEKAKQETHVFLELNFGKESE